MDFNATFIVSLISFVFFIMIMNVIFYKPILNVMKKREDYICNNYENAKSTISEANAIKSKRDSELASTQEICRGQIKDALAIARDKSTNQISESRENAKLKVQSRKDELTNQEAQLKQQLGEGVVEDLASSIFSKFLGNQ